MRIVITRTAMVQPSIAQRVKPGTVMHVRSVEPSQDTRGWSRIVGANGVRFMLPTDAFREER